MIEVQSALNVSDAVLRDTMESAFSDYAVPLKLVAASFAFMMRQRGLDRSSSRVAIIDDKVAAIWLTAHRGTRAYLISSGTRPEYRARGIARALATDCLDNLRTKGAATFQTEVLRSNTTAAHLYTSLGMSVARELACYVIEREVPAPPHTTIHKVHWKDIDERAASLRDWPPSWQNNDLAMDAIADELSCFAHFDASGLAGYAVTNATSGTIFQIVVRRDMRRKYLGSMLLRKAQKSASAPVLRFINVDEGDAGFRGFMTSISARETEGQNELLCAL